MNIPQRALKQSGVYSGAPAHRTVIRVSNNLCLNPSRSIWFPHAYVASVWGHENVNSSDVIIEILYWPFVNTHKLGVSIKKAIQTELNQEHLCKHLKDTSGTAGQCSPSGVAEVMGGRAELWSLSTEFPEHTVSLKTALKHSQRSGFMKDGLKKAST